MPETGMLPDGQFWQAWQPEGSPRAVLLIAHGLAEHSGRYTAVAGALTAAGYAVYAIDHDGHGNTPGKRCAVSDFNQFISGMLLLRDQAAGQHPELPVTLIGHSMGGLIAAMTALHSPSLFHTLVLSGPAVIAPEPPPRWQEAIVRFLARWLPNLGALALDSNEISKDPSVVQAYLDDPLVYNGKIPAGLVVALFDPMIELRERASSLSLPMLVMHGEVDKLTAPEGSALLVEQASSSDKTLKMWPGLRHEIFNEPERDAVIQTMIDWLNARH